MLRKRGHNNHNNSPDSEGSRRSWSSESSAGSTDTGSTASTRSKRSATDTSMARPIEHQAIAKATIPAGRRRPSTQQTQVLSFHQLMADKPEICQAMEVVQEVTQDRSTDREMESLVAHFAQLTIHDKHPTR